MNEALRPTPNGQAKEVDNHDESFMIADQLTRDRLTYHTILDIEMCRGVHGVSP